MESSRRQILKATGALAALLPVAAFAEVPKKRRICRLAHFTDIHLRAAGPCSDWFEKALVAAQKDDRPDMIMFGGDCIMDGLVSAKDVVKAQWKQFQSVVRANTVVPVDYCIGNHDIFGWNAPSPNESDPYFGKAWAKEIFKVDRTYHSFDRNGWHFVVLDSMTRAPHGYVAKLDEDQFGWLQDDLAANKSKPTLITSHVPIIGAASMMFTEAERDHKSWHVPGWLMHIDGRRLKDLFNANKQVKICLSGHVHMLDRVDYNGVSYLCNGAICGSWWKGPQQETQPGYAMLDLFNDGTFKRQYVNYGWTV